MESTVIYARAAPTASPVAIAVGACFALILYGQVSQGAYQYFRRYPKDGYDLKVIIAALIFFEGIRETVQQYDNSIFDTLQTVSVTHVCFASVVDASSHPEKDLQTVVLSLWSFWIVAPSSGVTMFIAHSFFARRVYKLGRQPLVFHILMGVLVVSLVGVVAFLVAEAIHGNGVATAKYESVAVLGISLLTNIALTWRLVLHLRRSRTGFRSTDTLLNRLIYFSINTGFLTGVLTSASIILLAAWPFNFAYYPVSAVLAPVHASVVLAALNSRRSLVDRGSEGIELRSFDLDIAPRLERSETIRFTTPSGTILEGPGGEASAGVSSAPAHAIQVQFTPPEDEGIETTSTRKTGSMV